MWSHYVQERTAPTAVPLTAQHRAALWLLSTTGHAHPTRTMIQAYKTLLSYNNFLKIPSKDRTAINNDVGRTFAPSSFSSSPPTYIIPRLDSLRNVLTAYVAHKDSVGYCQGMNFVVGLLLICFSTAYQHTKVDPPQTPQAPQDNTPPMDSIYIECATLHTFVGIMQPQARWGGHDLYRQGLIHIRTMMGVHGHLVEMYLPALASHFAREQVVPDLYSVSWFMTLFSNLTTLPHYNCALETLTLFIVSGWKATHRTALAILESMQATLVTQKFGEICMTLRQPIADLNYAGRSFKVTRTMLKRMTRQVRKEEKRRKERKVQEVKAREAARGSTMSPLVTPPSTPPPRSNRECN